MTKIYCDICKKEKKDKWKMEIKYFCSGTVASSGVKDICEDCKSKLGKFINDELLESE